MLELIGFLAIAWLAYREFERWANTPAPPSDDDE